MISAKPVKSLLQFFHLLRNGFCEHRGIERAATLTYTTLLSLVQLCCAHIGRLPDDAQHRSRP
jgi:uncharacterized BrkB/YihY/UPF0761 family membrane protein